MTGGAAMTVQLVVLHPDGTFMYHRVPPGEGWRVDGASRCLVIGKFPRTYVPLDRVRHFSVEAFAVRTDPPPAASTDMPAFTIKAKDALALDAVKYYRALCLQAGLTWQAGEVSKAIAEMVAWRDEHADQVQMPDHVHTPAGVPTSGGAP